MVKQKRAAITNPSGCPETGATLIGLIELLAVCVFGVVLFNIVRTSMLHGRLVDKVFEAAGVSPMEKSKPQRTPSFDETQSDIYQSMDVTFRWKYDDMEEIAEDIERYISRHSDEIISPEIQQHQLDRLLWTALRLLRAEQDYEVLIRKENHASQQLLIQGLEAEIAALDQEISEHEQSGNSSRALQRSRVRESKTDRLRTLQVRDEKMTEIREKLELTVAERERITSKLKLIQAEFHSSPDLDAISDHIERSAEVLATADDRLSRLEDHTAPRSWSEPPPLTTFRQERQRLKHRHPPLPLRVEDES